MVLVNKALKNFITNLIKYSSTIMKNLELYLTLLFLQTVNKGFFKLFICNISLINAPTPLYSRIHLYQLI